MEVRAGDRRLTERRVPRAPGTPQLIGQAFGVERVPVEAGGGSRGTGALRHRAQRQRAVERLADHVQLVVEHEEIAQHRRSEEHTSELQSPCNLVCRLLLEKKKKKKKIT